MREVTLVLVETESYALAKIAVSRSLERFPFARALIFTDRPELFPGLDCVLIPKLQSMEQYNRLMLLIVPDFIQTEFFMTVQFDGFVLNASLFDPVFYGYDYIGAPWNGEPEETSVGNGGFSWRSKRLADAVKASLGGDEVLEAEDLIVCKRLRGRLEAGSGCVFAPRSVASRFSFEFPAVDHPTFGFHGVFNLPALYRDDIDFLINHLPDRVFHPGAAFNLLALTMDVLGLDRGLMLKRAEVARN